MSNTAAEASTASTSSFITSLAVNMAVAGGEFVAWVIFRQFLKAVYEPRTYIPPSKNQAAVLGRNLISPLVKIVMADPEDVLRKNGVDPYVFIRFLRMMAKAMFPIWLISWIILLPVDSVNSSVAGKTGLDRFTFGNVAKDKQSRYWAHLILTILFNVWFLYLVSGEMKAWLTIRQQHLINSEHSKRAQASTVLVTGIPQRYMDEEKLAQLFSYLPGGVKRIWLNRDLKEMPDLYNRRVTATAKLESAQVKIIKLARAHKIDVEKKIASLRKKNKPIPDDLVGIANPELLRSSDSVEDSSGTEAHSKELSLADQLVPRKQRPTMRLKPSWSPIGLGFLGIGEKVDTIDWCRKEIVECGEKLEIARMQLEKDINHPGVDDESYPPLSSAFIHFNQQIAAHMAHQCLTHNQPYKMSQRYIEQSPSNVIWRNMSLNSYEANIRQAISYAITVGLIIAWSFPVAFIGILSNVTTLTSTYPWLDWINGSTFGKKLLQGVISGILPPVFLALLMLLVPAVLRQLAAFEGIPSKTEVELDLMTRYFIFLVIHTFLIVTLASGLIASVSLIASNPASVANILASQLPTASTFFITLVLTQFTGNMGTLLQPITLVLYYVRVILGGGTPRSVFSSRYRMPTNSWGTIFPGVTVYAVIMISYMVISPIINGFGACFFLLCYCVYKYLYIWVDDQPVETDTGGLFFPKAITHVFVGMYIQEICICALFFLARDESNNASAIPEAAIMIVVIIFTAGYHYMMIESYGPLIKSLPLSLAHLSYGMASEDSHTGSIIGENGDNDRVKWSGDRFVISRPAFVPSFARTASTIRRRVGTATATVAYPMTKIGDAVVKATGARDQYGNSPINAPTPVKLGVDTNNAAPRDFVLHDVEKNNDSNSKKERNKTTVEIPTSPTAPGPPVKSLVPTEDVEPRIDVEMGPINEWARDPSVTATARAGEDEREEEEEPFFAVPGGPGVIRPGSSKYEDDGNDPMAFFHPATKEPARVIWLPRDELGLAVAEIEANQSVGIESTSRYARLTKQGRIKISGPPPDSL